MTILRKVILAATMVSLVIPIGTAIADPPPWAPAHGKRAKDADHYYEQRDERHYYEPRMLRYDEQVYHGDDGRYYCRRSDGTTGLIVGAAVGGLVGNRLARGKSETLGTLLGAWAGAMLGQAIEKDSLRCD